LGFSLQAYPTSPTQKGLNNVHKEGFALVVSVANINCRQTQRADVKAPRPLSSLVVVDKEKMRQNHWLGSVIRVFFSAFTRLAG